MISNEYIKLVGIGKAVGEFRTLYIRYVDIKSLIVDGQDTIVIQRDGTASKVRHGPKEIFQMMDAAFKACEPIYERIRK